MALKYDLPGYPPSIKKILAPYLKVFFGQFCEDVIIGDLVDKTILPRTGFYVDLGGYHPIDKSNTMVLYLVGWKGMNVDANPEVMDMFKMARPNDINICCGVSNKAGIMQYFTFEQNGVNTLSKEHALRMEKKGAQFKEIIDIPCREVNELLTTELPPGQHIDLLNIDLEGLDEEILYALDWERFRPTVILFEIFTTGIENHVNSDIHRFLKDKGYKLFSALGLTVVYHIDND